MILDKKAMEKRKVEKANIYAKSNGFVIKDMKQYLNNERIDKTTSGIAIMIAYFIMISIGFISGMIFITRLYLEQGKLL